VGSLEADPPDREPAGWEAVVPAPVSVVPAPVDPETPGPGVGAVGSVGSVGGGVLVLVELLVLDVLVLEVVGGSVVGGGAVLVVVCRALVVGGAAVVEVVWRRLVLGTITADRERVVVGAGEVAGETRWRWGSVVVVVCWVACADCLGEVVRPTMLPPIAPISIAATTLTHRRAATKRTGLKRRTPPVRAS
jgi:hypothetical protein